MASVASNPGIYLRGKQGENGLGEREELAHGKGPAAGGSGAHSGGGGKVHAA